MAEVKHPSAIDVLLANARADLDRVQPAGLAAKMAAGAVVVDIRPIEQRRRDGELPGALIIDRNVVDGASTRPVRTGSPRPTTPDCESSWSAAKVSAPASRQHPPPARPGPCHRPRWWVPSMATQRAPPTREPRQRPDQRSETGLGRPA